MRIFNFEITKGTMIIIGAIIVIILLLASVFLGFLPGSRPEGQETTTLEFWGLYDDLSAWQTVFNAFKRENPNISFRYIQMNPETYEKALLEALASGKAPDIIMFHSSWLPKHGNKVSPLPQTLMSLKDFQETFIDIAVTDFISKNQIYAIPVWTDVLVMVYNKDLFNTAGIATPPKNWDEFINVVQKLSVKDKFGNLTKSGAAIGTADNINNSADILSLLMLQSGSKMISDDGNEAVFDRSITIEGSTYSPGESALRFYTDFSNPKSGAYSWNNNSPNSFDAFNSGKTAIIFDYLLSINRIKQASPNLRFGLAGVPQLKDATKDINYGDFWGYSVPMASKNSENAWKFLVFLTTHDINKYFSNNVLRPSARRDVLGEQQSSPDLGVFAEAALSATNWYRVDPVVIDDIFKDMINSVVLDGEKPRKAVSEAAARGTALMRK
ncbi:MAG: extracellular solute-binding protein [Patescibacteria group bacterium]